MINKQFYPTPNALANRMWEKIKGTPQWLLEPSAGRANLLENYSNKYRNVDCLELDLDNAAILRSKGLSVVGHDFLSFTTPKQYSHILMNPPFRTGVSHVMHAWDNILSNGQIVAIINAECIKNPNDKQKRRLVKLLEQEGNEVEFIESAFMHEDVERKTTVEVALISLTKTRNVALDYSFLDDLTAGDFPNTQDQQPDKTCPTDNQLAIPQSVITNAVVVYNAACRALRREIDITKSLRQTTRYYTNLLEESILRPVDDDGEKPQPRASLYSDSQDQKLHYNARLADLKERAWSTVLTQTDIGKNLSSAVLKDLTSRFEQVKALEFTELNILSFLQGLAAQSSDMQMQMLCEVHRELVSYGHENQIYYKGWKSNDKHRVAFRIKSSRIILPLRRSFMGSVSYTELEKFKDIDKALDLLSGHQQSTYALSRTIESHAKSGSARIAAGHFEIRMYSESIHLYPLDPKLIDTLNLWVGRYRNWIPPTTSPTDNDAFWRQYNEADKFQKVLIESPLTQRTTVWRLMNPRADDDHSESSAFNKALERAATHIGLDMKFNQINHEEPGTELSVL